MIRQSQKKICDDGTQAAENLCVTPEKDVRNAHPQEYLLFLHAKEPYSADNTKNDASMGAHSTCVCCLHKKTRDPAYGTRGSGEKFPAFVVTLLAPSFWNAI